MRMRKEYSFWKMNKWVAIFLIFLFSISLRLWNLNQMGRTWDEQEYVEQGYKMVELLKQGDFDNSYFYTTYDHPPLVKYLYGITAHFDLEKVLPNGDPIFVYDLTYSRLLSAFAFSFGVAITAFIGWSIFSPFVGITAGIILSLLPFSLGLSQLVTTESFKIFIYPLAFYSYMLLLKSYSFKKLVFAGIVTGIALQIKQSNSLLILLFGLMSFVYYRQIEKKEWKAFIKRTFYSIIAISFFGAIVFIALWPQMLFHPREIYEVHSKLWHVQFVPKIWLLTLSVPEVFFGRLMLTPNFYYFVYFFISIPAVILGFFLIGIKDIIKRKNWRLTSLILWFIVPFVMSFYSWRQHGLRYIIEIYPPIALIAAIGFDAIIRKLAKKERLRLLFFVPVAIYLLISLWKIKPYFLDYFNELVGGVNTVYRYNLFQTGWWGQGMREAGLYLKKSAEKDSRIGLAISPEHTFPKFEEFKYSNWLVSKKYDYVVVNHYHVIRDGFSSDNIKKYYIPAYFVKADDATLVTVFKKRLYLDNEL